MINLKQTIVAQKPRETAGATSSSRFDYQKDWSLCQLLEHHEKGSDYLLLFDYHEDLIVMNSESEPNKISFYQLKGKKSGNWSLTNLLDSEKNKDGNPLLSIVGKLFDCKQKFNIETESLNFVSNARFNLKLDNKSSGLSKDKICIIELPQKDKNEIKRKLKEELSVNEIPEFEDAFFLKVTELSLNDSAAHSRGKLSDFLDKVKPNGKFAIPALYQNLFNEVKKRTAYNKEILTFDELIEKKGIGKKLFDTWINNLGVQIDFDDLWKRIESALGNDKLPVIELKKIKNAWVDLELALKNPNNNIVIQIKSKVKNVYKKLVSTSALNGLLITDCLDTILKEYSNDSIPQTVYDQQFIKAVILLEIYE